jgi:GntR family transcriptional regulator
MARNVNNEPGRDNGEAIRDLAEKLENRGLSSRVATYSGEKPDDELIEEIVVTNPVAPERGSIRIGDDGAITWEFFGNLGETGASRLLDEATNALRATGVRFQLETRPNWPNSPVRAHLQLAASLRQQIERGEIATRLPSIPTLIKQTRLSKKTVRDAIRVLVEEGLILTVPGRGTFVAIDAVVD